MTRILSGIFLAICLAIAGFGFGGLAAAHFAGRGGDPLAGAATTTLVALLSAASGIALALLIVLRTRKPVAPMLLVAAALLSIAATVLVGIKAGIRAGSVNAASTASPDPVDSAGRPVPPPLPARDVVDSLIALITVAPESIPRFETREYDYEVSGVTVYGQRGNWYLVGAADSTRTWLHTSATGRVMFMDELLVNRLNYMTIDWDGTLRDAPDAAAAPTPVDVKRSPNAETSANVVDVRRTGGTLWVSVQVLSESPCEGGTPRVVRTGWVPAWSARGKPTVWFYSRGC